MRLLTSTKEIEIEGMKFVIGAIPARIWKTLEYRHAEAVDAFKALTESIRSENHDEELNAEKIAARIMKEMPPEKLKESDLKLFDAHWEMVKYGVRAHSGLVDDAGEEIEFKITDGLIADEILEIYALNELLPRLATEVLVFNKPKIVLVKN